MPQASRKVSARMEGYRRMEKLEGQGGGVLMEGCRCMEKLGGQERACHQAV